MAVWAIGDIQGCFDELMQLLEKIEFDQKKDQLWFCGDLVNRGPKSLETLRFVKDLGDAAVTVLGNHDLHLLAKAYGHGKELAKDTLDEIIHAYDCEELLTWLRHQPVLYHDESLGYSMVHAGVIPQWNLTMARQCAAELEATLRGHDYMQFIKMMYGNKPKRWSDDLHGIDRLRFITNVFTRIRYCSVDGELDLKTKGIPGTQIKGAMPWFEIPGRRTVDDRLVFGHWSTLGIGIKNNTLALDGGCLWGGSLVAARLDSTEPELMSLACQGVCSPT